MCNQLWDCWSFPSPRRAVGSRAGDGSRRDLKVKSRQNYSCGWARSPFQDASTSVGRSCCSKGLQTCAACLPLPERERKWVRKPREISTRCEGVLVPISCFEKRWCGLWRSHKCIFNILNWFRVVKISFVTNIFITSISFELFEVRRFSRRQSEFFFFFVLTSLRSTCTDLCLVVWAPEGVL